MVFFELARAPCRGRALRCADLIRTVTLADFPDLFDIARESYVGVTYDEAAMDAWGRRALATPTVIGVRSDDAWGFAQVSGAPWLPSELHGSQLYICCRKSAVWQAVSCMRIMIAWTMEKGAVDYHFGETTGMRMSAIAKRIGAVPNSPTFVYRPGGQNAACASRHS